jgi:hypothetical protein
MSDALAHPLLSTRPADTTLQAPPRRIAAPIALGTLIWLALDLASPFVGRSLAFALAMLAAAAYLILPNLLRWSSRTSRVLGPLAWLSFDLIETAAGRDASFALAMLTIIICLLAPTIMPSSPAPQRA